MKTSRLEAFSDGVMAIIITIMVLELEGPEDITLNSLYTVLPTFLSYLLSFIYVGIYWNNHHHLFQVTEKVNGKILWANLHLLFWLSLIPFSTSWVDEHFGSTIPVAFYGFVLFMSAIAYYILQTVIIRFHDSNFILRKTIGKDRKSQISLLLYLIGLGIAFWNTQMAIACYIIAAVLWIIPDKRIENNLA